MGRGSPFCHVETHSPVAVSNRASQRISSWSRYLGISWLETREVSSRTFSNASLAQAGSVDEAHVHAERPRLHVILSEPLHPPNSRKELK